MAHFAFANYVSTVLWSAPAFLLPLLVINVLGREANAYFYIAFSISGLLAMIPMAVSLSVFAHGSHDERHLARHTLEGARFAEQATRLLWVLALGALVLLARYAMARR